MDDIGLTFADNSGRIFCLEVRHDSRDTWPWSWRRVLGQQEPDSSYLELVMRNVGDCRRALLRGSEVEATDPWGGRIRLRFSLVGRMDLQPKGA